MLQAHYFGGLRFAFSVFVRNSNSNLIVPMRTWVRTRVHSNSWFVVCSAGSSRHINWSLEFFDQKKLRSRSLRGKQAKKDESVGSGSVFLRFQKPSFEVVNCVGRVEALANPLFWKLQRRRRRRQQQRRRWRRRRRRRRQQQRVPVTSKQWDGQQKKNF